PGWWALLLLIPAAGWGLWRLRRLLPVKAGKVRSEQPLGPGPRCGPRGAWPALPKPYDGAPAGAWLQQINGLLKRLCRNHYPHSQSHTLNGRKWLAFLDNRCPAAGLTRWMILVEGAYKPECKLDDKAITGLTQAVDTWIRKHV
ncbi:DUF4381 domain-containing protein, partial [Pseudomonas syringae pv. actinidifoliorum]|nr:DUF4381 domain-containing protein [Pseudomonas syringae pv. actinidifoliorum]